MPRSRSIGEPAITVLCAADAFVDYALDLCSYALDTPIVRAAGATGQVSYGGAHDAPVVVPRVAAYSRATVPGLPDDAAYELAQRREAPFPFDFFSALRFWLADEGNEAAPDAAYDEHDRLRANASIQSEAGVLDIPVVNAYLDLFGHWLRVRSLAPVRQQRQATVILSHDVDSAVDPIDPRHVFAGSFRARRRRRMSSVVRTTAETLVRRGLEAVQDPRGRHAFFEEIVDAEAERDLRSTFFFAPTSRFDPTGARQDVAYLLDRAPLPKICRALADRGCEIGLHVGYDARDDAVRIRQERERLEHLSGEAVRGSRHHYWHMSRPMWSSLNAHGAAGLDYDSSLAFNDAPGYRHAIALPYRPWDPQAERAVSTVQIPCGLMDGMVLAQPGATFESAVSAIDGFLDALKKYGGTAAVDWHEYTSLPRSKRYADWGRAYLHLLDAVADDPDIRVASFGDTVDEFVAASRSNATAV